MIVKSYLSVTLLPIMMSLLEYRITWLLPVSKYLLMFIFTNI